MFNGSGIDTEVGMLLVVGGFAWIAGVMVRVAICYVTERMGKREK